MQEGVLRKSGLEEAFGLWEEMRLFGFGVVEGATLNVVETAIHLDCNNFYLGGGQTIWAMIDGCI